jgi:hypothetical protein
VDVDDADDVDVDVDVSDDMDVVDGGFSKHSPPSDGQKHFTGAKPALPC